MYWLDVNKMRLVVVGIVAAIVLGGESSKADFTFSVPMLLDEPVNSTGVECFNCISSDGLEMYFERPVPIDDILSLNRDLYVSTRATTNDPWPVPVNIGPIVNSNYIDSDASLSSDGLELYFCSNRGREGLREIWVTTRDSKGAKWNTPVNLGPPINTSGSNMTPWITPDGLELYFSSTRPGGSGNIDIWVSKRASTNDPWQTPVNLGSVVNSAIDDCFSCLSPDGLVLFFCDSDNPSYLFRPGGHGQTDMWMTKRKSLADPWESPVNLGPGMNTSYFESHPRISPDGSVLYFTSSRLGTINGFSDIWQAHILPTVDFNGDGIVDAADTGIMIDCWGTDEPLCDIGPMPWGDGIVDVEDLKILVGYLFEECSLAESVE